MSGVNAMYAHFEEVTVTGIPALFTPQRIDHTTVPTGMFQYEIRHDDVDWCDPGQLAKGVMVNFYGTLLTSNPVQLGADGKLDFEPFQFVYEDSSGAVTIPQYLGKHPALGRGCMELTVASRAEDGLFFSQSEELDRKNGCIGHLRGDFGSGQQFYHTWWPHQNDRLNQEPFKSDLNKVVDWLRQDYSPLKDLTSMSRFCALHGSKSEIKGALLPSHGFRIDTKRFQYMLRCFPHKGDYNFYLYCYDKEAREQARTTPQKNTRPIAKKRTEPER